MIQKHPEEIQRNIKEIAKSLPQHVTLVAVSKTKPEEDLLAAYKTGQRIFGENKVQEMSEKYEHLPDDIDWHYIGHLQRNKVKYIVDFVSLIHGVDSFRLLAEIDKRARNANKRVACLLQIHIAEEDSKFGFDRQELLNMLSSDEFQELEFVDIKGLMGMATFTDDKIQVRREFKQLKTLYDQVKIQLPNIGTLSMGMSGDYQIAIEEGSTMVRIGSSIFGARK